MKDPRLTFVQNMGMAMDVFKGKHIPVAYMLARVPYDSVEERDAVYGTALNLLGGEVSGAA